MTGTTRQDLSGKVRIRRDIASMSAYTPTASLDVFARRLGLRAQDLIKLDANENPFGPSPLVIEALARLPNMQVYPDPESGALRDMLAGLCRRCSRANPLRRRRR